MHQNPCSPSPCGPNSQCREINGQPACSCVPGYIGSAPMCRPECIQSYECPLNKACMNQKCQDPCPGTCGVNAECKVVNHSPICSCFARYEGNPFTLCQPIGRFLNYYFVKQFIKINTDIAVVQPVRNPIDPCQPSPCGPNSQCRVVGEIPSCSCLKDFTGVPPNCRPECVSNVECPNHLACINQKCKDPCPGLCGQNAECRVISHAANCICLIGFIGDPFSSCAIPPPQLDMYVNPCNPNPCGANAVCREQNRAGACSCLPEYVGNPYDGCRPECVVNSDCSSSKSCRQNKCVDPCPGVCGQNARCQVVNHAPNCICHAGYSGDPFQFCRVQQNDRLF